MTTIASNTFQKILEKKISISLNNNCKKYWITP